MFQGEERQLTDAVDCSLGFWIFIQFGKISAMSVAVRDDVYGRDVLPRAYGEDVDGRRIRRQRRLFLRLQRDDNDDDIDDNDIDDVDDESSPLPL